MSILLKVQEAADECGISRSHLYRLMHRLEVCHIGRSVRITRRSVEKLVEELCETERSSQDPK